MGGIPLPDPGGGTPLPGLEGGMLDPGPGKGYPPPSRSGLRIGGGGTPTRTAYHVLAMRWAVCLLRSRRRTFLLSYNFQKKWPNDRLAPPPWRLAPPSGKSWIRHCLYFSTLTFQKYDL